MAGPPGPRPFLACAGRILLELFDDDSDDDLILEFLDDEPDERPKRKDFFEDIIPCMSPSDFKFHFRLSRETVAKILNMVHPRIASQKVAPGRPMVDPLKQTMVALWCLGNRESFRRSLDNDDGDDLVEVEEIRQGVVKRRKLASALARKR
ncbi:protein ALP1-like [Ixodes scapularis]